ncbi:MAG: hypothetical protein ACE5GD_03800 [Candidatus Geothermarchaeales archaeon]
MREHVKAIPLGVFTITLLLLTLLLSVPAVGGADAPSCTIISPNGGGWYTGVITVSASASDSVVQVDFQFSLDNNTWTYIETGESSDGVWSVQWDTTGITDQTVWVKARASNGTVWSEDASDSSFGVDNTPPNKPTLYEDHSGPDWTSHSSPYFTWNDPGDAGSGVSYYEGSKDGGSPLTVSSPYHPTWEDGTHTFKVRAVDNVGLSGSWSNTITVRIDTTPPSASISINDDAEYTASRSVTLSLSYSDATSGVYRVRYSNDGVWDTESWESPSQTKDWILTSGDETKIVYYQVKDYAGNVKEVSDLIILDTEPPDKPVISSYTHPYEDAWYPNNDPSFSWTMLTGIAGYSYDLDHFPSTTPDEIIDTTDNSKSYSDLDDGTWYFHVRARDNAGNWGPAAHYKIKIDTRPPGAPSPTADPSGWTNQSYVTISWSAVSDGGGSGVNHYEYRIDSGPWTPIGTKTSFKTPRQPPGIHRVYVRAVDNVRLAGDSGIVEIYIDQIPPTKPKPLSPEEGTHLDVGPTFSWSPADDSLSGVASYTLQIDTSPSFDSNNLKVFTGITAVNHTLEDPLSVGYWYWRVCAVDKAGNTGALSEHASFVSDRILITHGGVTDDRVDIGKSSTVWFTAVYEYDGMIFDSSKGVLYVNDSSMTWSVENSRWEKAYFYTKVAKHDFQVSSVKDLNYGLTVPNDRVGARSIIWDRVNVKLAVSDDRINIGDEAEFTNTSVYEFDGTPFIGRLSLNDTTTKSVVGRYGYKVKSISDSRYGLTVFQSNAVSVVFDRVNITISIADDRIDVGSEAPLTWTGIYEYDGTTFNGTVTYNNTQTIYDTVGRRGYTTSLIRDPLYGLRAFRSNAVHCIWDRIKIVDGGVTSSSTYVTQTETVWFQAAYEYDDVVFDASKGTLFVGGSAMTWSTKNNHWEHDFNFETPGARTFEVSGVSDVQHGLSTINDMVGPQSITWYIPTIFTIYLTPSSSFSGFKVDISGSLTHLNGSGIPGAKVLLSYRVGGGEAWFEVPSATSDLEGDFSAVWTPPAMGNYIFRAVLEPSTWIGREQLWNLTVTPFRNRYAFPVLSNSTVSNLIYDSMRNELRFTVSGPPGTLGYSSIIIAEDLAPGVTDIRVYLDGDRIGFNHRYVDDSWLLRFTYSHSVHAVTISLRSPPTLWSALAVALTASVCIVIILERRIKNRHITRAKRR